MSLKEVIVNKLENGKQLPLKIVECGGCKNEFIILDESIEYHPKYCCYCGKKFESLWATNI